MVLNGSILPWRLLRGQKGTLSLAMWEASSRASTEVPRKNRFSWSESAPSTRPGKHTREAMETRENHHFIAGKIIYFYNFPWLCEKLPEASWDRNPYGALVLELLSHPGLQASTEFDESDIQTFNKDLEFEDLLGGFNISVSNTSNMHPIHPIFNSAFQASAPDCYVAILRGVPQWQRRKGSRQSSCRDPITHTVAAIIALPLVINELGCS